MRDFAPTSVDYVHRPSWPAHNPLPACRGNCHQGRWACRTPDQCQDDIDDGPPMTRRDAVLAITLTAAAWAVPVSLWTLYPWWTA